MWVSRSLLDIYFRNFTLRETYPEVRGPWPYHGLQISGNGTAFTVPYICSIHTRKSLPHPYFLHETMAKCLVCSKNDAPRRNSANDVPPCLRWFYTHRSSVQPRRKRNDYSTPSPHAGSESNNFASLPRTLHVEAPSP